MRTRSLELRQVPVWRRPHAGLDFTLRQWIIFDEFNTEILPGAYYLEPQVPLGRFNDVFFRPLVRDFAKRINTVRAVKRYD